MRSGSCEEKLKSFPIFSINETDFLQSKMAAVVAVNSSKSRKLFCLKQVCNVNERLKINRICKTLISCVLRAKNPNI